MFRPRIGAYPDSVTPNYSRELIETLDSIDLEEAYHVIRKAKENIKQKEEKSNALES